MIKKSAKTLHEFQQKLKLALIACTNSYHKRIEDRLKCIFKQLKIIIVLKYHCNTKDILYISLVFHNTTVQQPVLQK